MKTAVSSGSGLVESKLATLLKCLRRPRTRRAVRRAAGLTALAVPAVLLSSACERAMLGPEEEPAPPRIHTSAFATVLDSLRNAYGFPALAGAIVTDEEILEADAVGSRRYGGPANVTASDLFHLGSDTKAFTATLLGVLVDQGRVTWTSTLASVFPEDVAVMRPEYRDVTLRDLLTHSAGLVRDFDITFHTATPRERRAEIVRWAVEQPAVAQRGQYRYSNVGYIVAGAVAEKVTGSDYDDLLQTLVLHPLGITSAGFGPMGTVGREDEPLQHTNSHAPVEPTPDADLPPVMDPAGRLHISIGDWARFIRWALLAAEGDQQSLVTPATAAMLTTPAVPDGAGGYYAMGWTISDSELAGGAALSHAGSNGLNYAVAWLAPGKHFAVISATNQGPGTSANPLNPVATRLIHYYFDGR